MEILKSAAKLVFILLAVTACIGFVMKILSTQDFMLLTTGAFAFYFSNKGDSSKEYAGK